MKVSDVMQRPATVISGNDPLELAHHLMRWGEFRHLPVVHPTSRVLIGLVSERDVLRAIAGGADLAVTLRTPVSNYMRQPVESIGPDADLSDAAALLAAKQLGCLPVVERGIVAGIVTTSDVLSALAQCPIPNRAERAAAQVSVASIMYREPIAVPPHATLVATAACMAQRGVRHACVVDGAHRVIGIVSDRDVRRVLGDPLRAVAPNYVPTSVRNLKVDHIMSDPRTVNQDCSLDQALALLLSSHVGALPVVDGGGKLCGIVSYIDLLRHLRDALTN